MQLDSWGAVHLYASFQSQIEELIRSKFEIIESSDRVREQEPDQFGYAAIHFLVKLGKKYSGARYDALTDLVCEIQVRTILQDAWAIVAHHLAYKREEDVPPKLRRMQNALSGSFEILDHFFDHLRAKRDEYSNAVGEEYSELVAKGHPSPAASLGGRKLNLDMLDTFLAVSYPDRVITGREELAMLLSDLQKFGYRTILDLLLLLQRAEIAVLASETKYPPGAPGAKEGSRYTGGGMVRMSLSLTNEQYLNKYPLADHYQEFIFRSDASEKEIGP